MRKHFLAALCASAFLVGGAPAASAQTSYSILGSVMIFAGNFCPVGWLPMDGRLLAINTNTALFSLLGTQYGGDGTTNFALPRSKPIFTLNGWPLMQCIATTGIFPARS